MGQRKRKGISLGFDCVQDVTDVRWNQKKKVWKTSPPMV